MDGISQNAYQVNLLMAGYDEKAGPSLYYMDYLASMNKLPFAVHGYGSFFSLSIFDRYYKPDLTQEEAYEVINKCVQEVRLTHQSINHITLYAPKNIVFRICFNFTVFIVAFSNH